MDPNVQAALELLRVAAISHNNGTAVIPQSLIDQALEVVRTAL